MERLQKVLAHAGVASRRRAEEMILAGRVRVDGEIVRTLGVRVDPKCQRITVDGQPIAAQRRVTYLLNKPIGILSTVRDSHGRATVRDLLRDVTERVYPVGRLDSDTSGVLLLTSDGGLAFRLTHPRFGVEKTYHALVRGWIHDEAVEQLAQGVLLDDGPTAPAKARTLWRKDQRSLIELCLHEGRNRQVRRMCQAVGHPVIQLKRVKFAFLTDQGVPLGAYRELRPEEVQRLRQLVGL